MKAIIYNSGLGKRMGDLTKNCPKSMVKLLNGETILERQLRLLSECGIKDIIITTGPFKELIENVTKESIYRDVHFTLVENPIYMDTNYIYSMYLARAYLDDDVISLHGDLVFNKELLKKVLKDKEKSLITINRKKTLPEKDFKGRIKDGCLQEVSISIFDDDCFALQPMYKLSKNDMASWVKKVVEFIEIGNNKVYAENAFNEILPSLKVKEFSYENDYIDEVDNPSDLERVSNDIRFFDYREQVISYSINDVLNILKENCARRVFIVSNEMFNNWPLKTILEENKIEYTLFTKYSPNPKYEDIFEGVKLFNKQSYDMIISLGGGSSIDTAKLIKLYAKSNISVDILPKEYQYNSIKHLSIPTTAGTGSESTRYAVMYFKGVKQSIQSDMIVPEYALLDGKLLDSLPLYQKGATVLDALSQGIESFWCINRTLNSISDASKGIKLILDNVNEYMHGNNKTNTIMLKAANLIGKAINITQTTASHAMSYKLSSLYNIAHGEAVSITIPYVWEYLYHRGNEHIKSILEELNVLFEVNNYREAIEKYQSICTLMSFKNIKVTDADIRVLVDSVNLERLKNTPIELTKDDIKNIYIKALRK